MISYVQTEIRRFLKNQDNFFLLLYIFWTILEPKFFPLYKNHKQKGGG